MNHESNNGSSHDKISDRVAGAAKKIFAKLKHSIEGNKSNDCSFNPVELFNLFASAGEAGQQPIFTFESGSTLVFAPDSNFFPTQTIFRETYWEIEEGDSVPVKRYAFWCVGDYHEDGLDLFRVIEESKFNRHGSFLMPGSKIELAALKYYRSSQGNLEFVVGEEGNLNVQVLTSSKRINGLPDLVARWQLLKISTQTERIDIIQAGTPVKEAIKGGSPLTTIKIKTQPVPVPVANHKSE